MTTSATLLTLAQGPVQKFLFGGAGPNANAGEPGSAMASTVDGLFMAIFWISMFMFVLLMGLTLYFVFKYRFKPGVPSQRSVSHNTPLELFWTVVPLVVMTWIFFEGFWSYMDMQTVKAGAEPISVSASMWQWQFTYSNGAISPETLQIAGKLQPVFVVPAGKPVHLTLTSKDVIHSFWVPAFRNKRDVFPNRYTTYNFEALPLTEDDEWHDPIPEVKRAYHNLRYQFRDHYLFCAEFCGNQHSEMAAIIRVVEPEVYVKIVEGWGTPDLTTPKEKIEWLRLKYGCISCHSLDGSPGAGPTWMNLFGYEFDYTDGTTKTVDENHIRRAIITPNADIRADFPAGGMSPSPELSAEHLDWFIEGFHYLSDRGPKPMINEGGDDGADEGVPEGAEEGGETDEKSNPSGESGAEEGVGEGGGKPDGA